MALSATGSYIGNGVARTIDLGWQPDIVLVKGNLTRYAYLRLSNMPAGKSKRMGGITSWAGPAAPAVEDDRITGELAGGFTVGTADAVNALGVTYWWVAIQCDGADAAVGSYVGTAGAWIDGPHHNINVGLIDEPILVITAPANARNCRIRMADMGGGFGYSPTGDEQLDPQYGIFSLYNSGFEVGGHYDVDELGVTIYWMAIRGVAGWSTHGIYTGDGVDNRDIAVGDGVEPGFVLLNGAVDAWWWQFGAEFRITSHPLDSNSLLSAVVDATDNIQDLHVAAFEIGTALWVNRPLFAPPVTTFVYPWIALAEAGSGKSVADYGVAVDDITVEKSVCGLTAVDTSISTQPTAHPWSHAVIALPNALLLIYQEGTLGLMYIFTPDEGISWSTPALITSKTNVYPSAVADISTGDIHLIYSEAGDPALGAGNSVYYRSLINIGTVSPAWTVGAEVEVAYGSPGAGYANAVLSVEQATYDPTLVGGYEGKLMFMALRKTDTDRTWSVFVAVAAWTLQGAVENPAVFAAASGNERAAVGQAGGRLYAVTFSGGRYAFYRSLEVAWGDSALEVISWDGWGADDNEGFGLAVDFWGSQIQEYELMALYGGSYFYGGGLLYGSSGMGPVTLVTRQAAVAYIKDGQIHYREWGLPDDDTPVRTMYDHIVWSSKNAYQTTISRVGQSYRISAIVGMPSAAIRSVVYADGPDHSTWLAIASDHTTENWSWLGVPQYATSGFNWIAAWSETTGPPNNVYMGRCPMALTLLIRDVAVGSDLHNLMLQIAETGTGVSALTLVLRVVDVGQGVSLSQILHVMEDVGAGSDVAGNLRMIAEVGAGLEELAIALYLAEAGAGAEAATIGLFLSEAGTGLEALVRQIMCRVYDVGVGLDTGSLTISVMDSSSGSDIPLISIAMVDTGLGVEMPIIVLSVADSSTAVDFTNILYRMLEAGAGGEALGIGLSVGEAATGAESLRVILNIIEGGIGSDQVSAAIYVTLALLRLLVSRGQLRLDVEGPGL